MIEKQYNDTLYFEIDGFGDNKVQHIFSSRKSWDQKNIFKMIEFIFKVESNMIYRPKQIHGTNILTIDNQDNRIIEEMEADGLITNKEGIVLSTYHADCVPLYFYDNVERVIGSAHSGWRGSLENIAEKMISKMINQFNSRIENIQVAVGPSICTDCYEVKDDVSNLFIDKFGDEIIKYKNNKEYLDLWLVNKKNLLDAGVLKRNLYMSNYCTSCNINKLYSYRKENNTKNRMITGIMLVE